MLNKFYLLGDRRKHYLISSVPLIIGIGVLTYSLLPRLATFFRTYVILPFYVDPLLAGIMALIMGATTAALVMYPKFRLGNEAEKLRLRLPYIILKLRTSIMAGDPPLQAFINTAASVNNELLNVIVKKIVLGEEPAQAVEYLRTLIGNKPEVDVLKRVVQFLELGPQSERYLKDEFEFLMAEKERALNRALENLSMIVEIYMALGVFAPIVGIVMLSSLSMLARGIDVISLIAIIIFVAIPLLSMFSSILARRIIERALL